MKEREGPAPVRMAWLAAGIAPVVVLLAIFILPVWFWFFCRIEPGADEFAVLIRKTGKNLPSGQILALEPGQKGIQLDVLSEGRYFKNPYTWDWRKFRVTDIPAGMVGIRTRLHGEELGPGRIIAGENTKGIVKDVLRPGKYRINPFAYHVELLPAISIKAGCVGVVTSLVGDDPLNDELPEEKKNTFLVEEGMKGTLSAVLDPGAYYLNPYMFNVVEVNLQSQRFEMSGDDAISFLTLDGFIVVVEGTVEFAIEREKAALLTHRVGDMDDIVAKIIMPRARGFSRIAGSKNPAINYIVGESRQEFQNNLQSHLMEQCGKWGVSVKSLLIRNIRVPEEIAGIIRDREVAVQNAKKFEQQIEQAKSKAELAKQEMLAVQNGEKVNAETAKIRAVINAEQDQSVLLTAAQKDLEVAKIEKEAAEFQAQAVLSKAQADRDVVKMNNEAQAGVFAEQAAAFGSGMNFARYVFYQKLAPSILSILSNDGKDGMGAMFAPYMPEEKEEQP